MAASRLDSHLSWAVTACLLLLFLIALFGTQPATGATCVRDSYSSSSLPDGAVFPTQTLSSALVPSGRVLVKNHWSEVAQYSKYRPAKVTPSVDPPQSGCPHLDQLDSLKDWHATSTWTGGSVPANGTNVTIPANTRVLVSSCSIDRTFVFKTITIPAGSALILGDAQISMAAAGFDVQGEFLVGSPTCRLRNNITITLHGSRDAQLLPASPPVKGIAASGGGRVDIHGMRYFPTWSRLAMTAEKGDSYLFIQDMVNWQPGQSIFITSTEIKDSRDWHRNEVRTIVKVYRTLLDSSVAAIQLDAPLDYQHYGGREYQAEVGLLTRNIVVRGDPFNSEPTDTANAVCKDAVTNSTYPCSDKYLTGFGGHVQVIGEGSTGRFSGVELYRMGQTNVLGRYPLQTNVLGRYPLSWWKMHSSCKLVAERWVCPMDDKDSSAALKFRYNAALEAQIVSTICVNGNGDGTKNCTVVGKATLFGRNESLGVDLAAMGQLTGPIVYKAGGWFIRYTAGTPNVLNLTEIQVDPKDSLVLAFPYPAGTKFNIFFQAASWCSTSWAVCTHPFRNVSSVAEVANGFGDVYYWDNAAQVLYVRATMQPATFGSPGKDAPWTSIPPAPGQFTRGGLTLPLVNGGPLIVIKASCSTNPCAPQTRVSVPRELRPYYTDSEDSSAADTQPWLSTLARALL